jgi:spore coat protein U-like protein
VNIFRPRAIELVAILCLLPLSGEALATGAYCSVSGASTTSIGAYNPFTGSTYDQVPITLRLTRYGSGGGKLTRHVNFYLVKPAGSLPGVDVRYQGSSVLYTLPATHALSLLVPAPSGTVGYDFGGAGQPNTVSIPLLVTLPPGLDWSAGAPLILDMVYICSGSGGLNDVRTPTTMADAVTVQVTVVSALQASYAGPALDFGEIGGVSDAQAAAHTVNGAVRVASTGPYAISLASANGYRMMFPGAVLGESEQSIRYSARFLGQTKTSANPVFVPVSCLRSGTAGQSLPISVQLREGGESKMPAPNYSDTLTVTVTPLAVPFGGFSWACANL